MRLRPRPHSMNRAIPFGLRALQFVAALAVLILAAILVKRQVMGSPPATTRFATFTGVVGMLASVIGVWSLVSLYLSPPTPAVFDVLAGLLFLAGGIASALGLYGVDNCNLYDIMLHSPLLNQGSTGSGAGRRYGVVSPNDDESAVFRKLHGNCWRAQLWMILQFVSFGIAVGLVTIGYLQIKRAKLRGAGAGVSRYPAD
ncbi:hypothetical protein VTI74DRAFT_6419 [Chaetomium olivicolor]